MEFVINVEIAKLVCDVLNIPSFIKIEDGKSTFQVLYTDTYKFNISELEVLSHTPQMDSLKKQIYEALSIRYIDIKVDDRIWTILESEIEKLWNNINLEPYKCFVECVSNLKPHYLELPPAIAILAKMLGHHYANMEIKIGDTKLCGWFLVTPNYETNLIQFKYDFSGQSDIKYPEIELTLAHKDIKK